MPQREITEQAVGATVSRLLRRQPCNHVRRGATLSRNLLIVVAAAVVLVILRSLFHQPPLTGCGPFGEPYQNALKEEIELSAPPGFRIYAMDEYEAKALVVSARRYSRDREAKFSPLDLALAWGPLTTQAALDAITYTQSTRWYFYSWKNTAALPVIPADISNHSANTHIVLSPDRDDLKTFAKTVRRGDIVTLKGYLVRITGDDGWRWTSSRVRTDGGGHSCEVLYLTEARISGTP